MLVDGSRLPDWPLHSIPHLGDDCRTVTPLSDFVYGLPAAAAQICLTAAQR